MANIIEPGRLKAYVQRFERLQGEKDEIDAAMRDVVGEVKAAGYDVKLFREAIAARKQDQAARAEHGELLTLYLEAAK